MGLISRLTAVAVILLVITNNTDAASLKADEGITLDEILTGKFSAQSHNGTWISGNEFIYQTADRAINIYNVATSTSSIIVPGITVNAQQISNYRLSPDRKFLLYSNDYQASYRHSSRALYFIVDLTAGSNFASFQLQPNSTANPQQYLNYATWNKQGSSVIYVYNNDIYFRAVPTNVNNDARLTFDGVDEGIFNGIPDWVYEEEVLGTDNAIWIANDGKKMVYATFDDRQVDHMQFSLYGTPGKLENQYPVTADIRYPKAGRTNPTVKLTVTDKISGGSNPLIELRPPADLSSKDYYFTTIALATNDEVMIVWINRHQNESQLAFCNALNGACSTELPINVQNGWVSDQYSAPIFSANGRRFIHIVPVDQTGGVGNFKHAVLYDRDTKQTTALTSGRWEVTRIAGWDEASQSAYVVGTAVDKPAQRHLYKVSVSSANRDVLCLSCGTTNIESKECTYNSAGFSMDLSYFVHGCNGPSVPRSVIRETSTLREVYVATNNEALVDKLSAKALPVPLSMQVPLGNGYQAQVRLLLPPKMNGKHPMLVYVYAGPGSQYVNDQYTTDWGSHLASEKGVIYARIDGRGSGYQGDKLLHEIYRRMGSVEIEDQIIVTKYLQDNLPFVDRTKTAIWGWSYGGYATASVMATDSGNVFKCGMSVAPVTNWIYYDSIYTERYMGLPTADDNLKSYEDSDVCSKAKNFRGKQFYLIHGTADDNVHYQQSLMLAKALESEDVLFRQQSYTDENHGIYSYRPHLYHSLETFLMTDCFGIEHEVWG